MVLSLTVKNFVTVKIVRVCCGSVSAKAKKKEQICKGSTFCSHLRQGEKEKEKKEEAESSLNRLGLVLALLLPPL